MEFKNVWIVGWQMNYWDKKWNWRDKKKKLSGKKVTLLGQKMELKFNMQRGERGIRKNEFFFGTKNEFFWDRNWNCRQLKRKCLGQKNIVGTEN